MLEQTNCTHNQIWFQFSCELCQTFPVPYKGIYLHPGVGWLSLNDESKKVTEVVVGSQKHSLYYKHQQNFCLVPAQRYEHLRKMMGR